MNTLLPYQADGVRFALERRGAIIADEMGLGKTVQAIGVINADPTIRSVLIICPVGLSLNWRKELNRFLDIGSRDVSIDIIGYSVAHKRTPVAVDLVILDEAHYIKNPKAQRTIAVQKLCKQAKRAILLSGTPFENRVAELWPLLQVADPKTWDPQKLLVPHRVLPGSVVLTSGRPMRTPSERNFWDFAMRYCGPQKKTFRKEGRTRTAWEFKGGSNLAELNQKLRASCMIRRLKKDVLSQLPPKRREITAYPTKHAEDDPLFFSSAREITVGNYDEVVRKLHANKVAFAEWSKARYEQGMEKVPHVLECIDSVLEQTDKVVVFAHHRDVIEVISNELPDCVVVTGETSVEDRQRAVEQFQNDPRVRVFVGAIRAAGVGLTLTAASVVTFAELDPNPAVMRQAEDRVHRIGQRDSVLVKYLVSDGSIDARLCKILVEKQALADKGLGDI